MKIAVSGATGRMGKLIIETILNCDDVELVATITAPDAPEIGTAAGASLGKTTGVLISGTTQETAKADVLIDFTRPEATLTYLPFCVEHNVGIVIGTTGFDAQGKEQIAEASKTVHVVCASNMSVGVNSVLKLLEIAGGMLSQYDCEIVEIHHKHKVDAPSGTAREMGRRVAQGRGVDFDSVAVLSREGHTGERPDGAIGFAALRGGDVVCDHHVLIGGPGERIEISHKSGSRAGYAQGAVTAARFLKDKPNGLFSMSDVLGFN